MMYEEENIESEFSKRLKKNPFKTPDHYFESIEERVMQSIKQEGMKNKNTPSGNVIRLIRPVLAVAASLAVLFMLVYYPVNYLTQKEIAKVTTLDSVTSDTIDPYSITISSMDENSLINTIINEEQATIEEINPDEMLAYLSSDMNDIEIYTEIQN